MSVGQDGTISRDLAIDRDRTVAGAATVLLAAVGDKNLAAMYADAEVRNRQAKEWLLFLSVVVQAELAARTSELRKCG